MQLCKSCGLRLKCDGLQWCATMYDPPEAAGGGGWGVNADAMIGVGKMLIGNASLSTFYPPDKSANQRVKC